MSKEYIKQKRGALYIYISLTIISMVYKRIMALSYLILDSGNEFIVVSEQQKITSFKYGQFALSICNTDYDKNKRRIAVALKNKHDVEETMAHCINTLYLDWEQLNVVVEMIAEEISVNIAKGEMIPLPDIYTDEELHQHIRKLLQREPQAFASEIQDKLNSVIINQSMIIFDGMPMTGYYLNNINEFLIVDIHRFLLLNRLVKECDYCKRLFIPSRKSDKYCKLPNFNRLTCGELAHKNRSKTDFERLRDKARPEQRSSLINISTTKKYDESILQQMYHEWSEECGKQFKKFKAKDDLTGFGRWIDKTKYTATRIEKEYNKRLKSIINSKS